MFHIRTTPTASGATAVQIVRYERRQKVIVLHLGSAHDNTELLRLKHLADEWIAKTTDQLSLFSAPKPASQIVPLSQCQYLGYRYGLLYETLSRLCTTFKFHLLHNSLLLDLVIARISEPGSKVHSLEFLHVFMGIAHGRRDLYRQLPELSMLQSKIESKVLAVAKKEFSFSCSLVFYDVTTLYFESFHDDDLRRTGFSKDNKSQQPQILIGLLVSQKGFPIAYQVFKGNTFEGHTFIPMILAFKGKYKITTLTVVADAAMISLENITALQQSNLQYVVAARTANLSPMVIAAVNDRLQHHDGATVRIPTEKYGDLICGFSAKRFAKDEREMNKQIAKAEELLESPSAIKRTKFIKTISPSAYGFNTDLVEKTKLLLGVKGYYTNLGPEVNDQLVIAHYHTLWQVEQAFRIAKSDLEMRPIYHYKEQTIKAHVLICFMALALCKYMELKTGKSTKHIITAFKRVTDARIFDTINKKEILMRSPLSEETRQLLDQLKSTK